MQNLDDSKNYQSVEEQMLGTKYPYLDISEPNILRSSILRLKSLIAPINPFAKQQVPSKDRITFGTFNNDGYYVEEPLPNPVAFHKMFPLHFDPLKQHFQEPSKYIKNKNTGDRSVLKITEVPKLKVCEIYLKKFKRCEMINGRDKCNDEGKEFLQVCPNFVLDTYREDKLYNKLHRNIQLQEYKWAMQVGEYNKTRSLSDVDGSKNYESGLRKNLRPNTLYSDDRYVNVTQQDIDAAKERYFKRIGGKPDQPIFKQEKIDSKYQDYLREKPLYF